MVWSALELSEWLLSAPVSWTTPEAFQMQQMPCVGQTCSVVHQVSVVKAHHLAMMPSWHLACKCGNCGTFKIAVPRQQVHDSLVHHKSTALQMQGLLGRLCGRAVRRAIPVSLSLRSSAAVALEGGSRGRGMGHDGSAPSTEGVPPHRHCCWLDGTGHSLLLLASKLPPSLIIKNTSIIIITPLSSS